MIYYFYYRIIIDFLSLEDLNEYVAEENAGSGDEDDDKDNY